MLLLLTLLTPSAQAQSTSSGPTDPIAPALELPAPVVGGQPSEPGDWPAVAALAYNGFVACTGVLVTPEWVLTAGHCAPNISEVYLDTTDLSAPGEVFDIDAFEAHPDAFQTFDVALAHLQTPATWDPIPLARDCIADDWIRTHQPVLVVGFGSTDAFAQVAATGLNEATLSIEDPVCSDEYRGCNADAMPAGELIAGGGGIDSCTGDSGAPLLLRANGRIWLAATTSRAAIPAPEPCGHGGIYVRADAIVDWIEQVTGETLPGPDCTGLNRPPAAEAPPIQTTRNQPGSTVVEVVDVELGQTWSMELVESPEHGRATVDGDRVGYLPDPHFVGEDTVHVRITDDGSPPESTDLAIPVSVDPGAVDGGCGCGQPGTVPSPAWWFLALFGWRRRR